MYPWYSLVYIQYILTRTTTCMVCSVPSCYPCFLSSILIAFCLAPAPAPEASNEILWFLPRTGPTTRSTPYSRGGLPSSLFHGDAACVLFFLYSVPLVALRYVVPSWLLALRKGYWRLVHRYSTAYTVSVICHCRRRSFLWPETVPFWRTVTCYKTLSPGALRRLSSLVVGRGTRTILP